MLNKILLSTAMILSLTLITSAAFANECKTDVDCKDGTVCVMALTPHQCKAPQAAGATCKRDAVCISKKCEIPAGKDAGVCK